jgi:hypothetical protein
VSQPHFTKISPYREYHPFGSIILSLFLLASIYSVGCWQ